MVLLSLAYHSLRNRRWTLLLTLCSIGLSVALLIGVEQLRVSARESFSGTISRTDLIVGARGGSLQLLLYSVFRLGSGSNDISYASYEAIRSDPAVAWTVPLSLGDSHHGFRVVGTNDDFYKHYQFHRNHHVALASGHLPRDVFDVVLGSEVERKLHYRLGQKIVLTHGLSGHGILDHKDKPFTIVGLLASTATPADRSLYVTLEGIEAMHVDWMTGAPPPSGQETPAASLTSSKLPIKEVSAVLVGTRSRMDSLPLQRKINTDREEALQAIIPGVALSQLWSIFGSAETALALIAFLVLFVSLLGMMASLLTSLNERRRELAILRVLGLGPFRLVLLLLLESCLLACAASIGGVCLVYGLFFGCQSTVATATGLFLPVLPLTQASERDLAVVLACGTIVAIVPALRAYRNTVSDGLSVRL